MNNRYNQQHRLQHKFQFLIYSPILVEWLNFSLISKKSEISSSIQKVDVGENAGLLSTMTFTDLGHVRIIVFNSMWIIWLWM